MEIKFDPDAVDLTTDPEYQARVTYAGPVNGVRWSEGDFARAKQLEMLDIDRDMHARWIATMEALVARDLSDAEFTAERMLRLKRWQRERKRLQHNLHYKYDSSRRRRGLVERDTEKMLAKMRARLEGLVGGRSTEDPAAPEPVAPPQQAPAGTSRRHEGYERLSEAVQSMIRTDIGGDPRTLTLDEIRAVYEARGLPPESIDYFVGLVEGTVAVGDPMKESNSRAA